MGLVAMRFDSGARFRALSACETVEFSADNWADVFAAVAEWLGDETVVSVACDFVADDDCERPYLLHLTVEAGA